MQRSQSRPFVKSFVPSQGRRPSSLMRDDETLDFGTSASIFDAKRRVPCLSISTRGGKSPPPQFPSTSTTEGGRPLLHPNFPPSGRRRRDSLFHLCFPHFLRQEGGNPLCSPRFQPQEEDKHLSSLDFDTNSRDWLSTTVSVHFDARRIVELLMRSEKYESEVHIID